MEHIHIRTPEARREPHMRKKRDGDARGGNAVPSARRGSTAGPRCRISLRWFRRPAGTRSSHPHLRTGDVCQKTCLFVCGYIQMERSLTDLMEELGQLDLHFLSLKHVIFWLFTDRGNLVKLTRHWICFLRNKQRRKTLKGTFYVNNILQTDSKGTTNTFIFELLKTVYTWQWS